MEYPENIVFFDGVCNLCNRLVNFLWKMDKDHKLYYASLQSKFANEFFIDKEVNHLSLDTVFFFSENKLYAKSRAIGHILLLSGSKFKFIGNLILFIPSFLADPLYSFIARIRYPVWGKRSSCRIPTKEEAKYFLQ